jgi:hypothetical protein
MGASKAWDIGRSGSLDPVVVLCVLISIIHTVLSVIYLVDVAA